MVKKIFNAFIIVGLIVSGGYLLSKSAILLGGLMIGAGLYFIVLIRKEYAGKELGVFGKYFKILAYVSIFPLLVYVGNITNEGKLKNSEDSQITDNNLFRSNKHFFRIRFPSGWKVVNGDGKNVAFKAVNNEIASITVIVIPTSDSLDCNDLTDDSLSSIQKMAINNLKSKYEVREIDSGVKYLCNQKCGYSKFLMVEKSLEGSRNMINFQFLTTKLGRTYIVGAKVEEPFENELKETLLASISSFCIEFYYKKTNGVE